jgi:nucleoside-diphosphate-sugar epimerase
MEINKPKLLVTGINGFIGLWITKKILETGEYDVRGTVRGKFQYLISSSLQVRSSFTSYF